MPVFNLSTDKRELYFTKADLSLANVNNTSDADKPLSSAATEAINLKEDVANKSVDLNLDAESDLKYPQ
jgi:hypothetical protein